MHFRRSTHLVLAFSFSFIKLEQRTEMSNAYVEIISSFDIQMSSIYYS